MFNIKKHEKEVSVVNAMLIIFAILMSIISFTYEKDTTLNSSNTLMIIDTAVCIVALIFGLIYTVNGSKKDFAKYYKTFMGVYTFASLITLVDVMNNTLSNGFLANSFLSIVVIIVEFVCLLILTLAKDFGKKNSLTLAYLVLALEIFIFVRACISYSEYFIYIECCFKRLVLSCIACVSVLMKYVDKDDRGTI